MATPILSLISLPSMNVLPNNGTFVGQLFDWPVDRTDRPYRVVLVEPPFLEPTTHAEIFNAAITTLVAPTIKPVNAFKSNAPTFEPFDLVTFPEAFLPASALIGAIELLAGVGSFGCVHVGLRPSEETGHLFTVKQLKTLIADLEGIPDVSQADLCTFSSWLESQADSKRFNVACLFTIDAEAKVRICLHPKMVRSKYEMSALPEDDMAEADMLSLVTLLPTDPKLLSVTMQPLICSDTLHLDTDKPGHLPIDAVNTHPESFDRRIPDHIDIVSVATCTPQTESEAQGSPKSRSWHKQFKNAFLRAAEDPAAERHAHAAFVLSNFWTIGASGQSSPNPGGLSGVFLPIKLAGNASPDFIEYSSYGQSQEEAENGWSMPASTIDPERRSRGFIAQLTPYGAKLPAARMLSFTIQRLPRHAQPWAPVAGLRKIQLRTAAPSTSGAWEFMEDASADSQ